MKLDLSQTKNSLSLLETIQLLEPLWVLAAMLLFAVDSQRGIWMAAGLVLLALSFGQRWATTGRLSRLTAFDAPWALLLTGAFVGLWASYDARLSLPVLLTLIGSIALYYAVANAPRSTTLAQVVLLVGLTAATCFLTQYQYIPHGDKSGLASLLGRITSALFPRVGSWAPFPNSMSTLLEGLIPLGIGLTLASRSWGWQMINGAATGIMGLAVLIAASRGAWVALLIAGVLWLASRWQKGPIVLAVAILIAFAAMIGHLALVEGATLTGIPIVGPVLYQLFARPDRLEVYQGSLRLLQDFLLTGIGPGEVFALVYSRYVLLIPHAFLTYSHNLYLTVWLEHGLLGIIGMGWLVVAFGSLVVRQMQQRHASTLFQASWVGTVAIFAHGLFDARQYVDLWTMWPLFALLGLVVSNSKVTGETEATKAPRARRSRRREWLVLGLLAVGCVVVWHPLMAAVYANLGAVGQVKAELITDVPQDTRDVRLRAAIANYQRALQLAPNSRTANLRLGNLAVADGRYEEGIARLEIVWRAAPEDATARKALGLAYAWVGEIDRAAQLLSNTKDIVTELNNWGWWHSREGRQQVAANAYRTSLALEPDQPHVQDLLAALESP